MQASAQKLYREREKRVEAAVRLEVPDRVPFVPLFTFFPARYAGISFEQAMYDFDRLSEAWKKAILEFEPDMYNSYAVIALGPMLERLQCRWLRWPGHGVAPGQTYQFVEKEYMKAEEYGEFLSDPTDFMLRRYLPRAYGALEGVAGLPSVLSTYYTRFLTGLSALTAPGVEEAFEALFQAGRDALRMVSRARAFMEEMKELGFPCQFAAAAYAPFDYVSDFLRGTRGAMLDMYRCPESLLAATERLIPYILAGAVQPARASGIPYVFMPMHKGLDGFMSLAQFKHFFWPSLRTVILRLIEEGLVPVVLWEGNCNSRLETIKDIPRGKAVYWFERTDIFKAKQVLGDTVCIRGNVPPSLLNAGSVEEVREYCRRLIREVGRGGGFILDGAIGIPDEARPENIKAMTDAVMEFGVY